MGEISMFFFAWIDRKCGEGSRQPKWLGDTLPPFGYVRKNLRFAQSMAVCGGVGGKRSCCFSEGETVGAKNARTSRAANFIEEPLSEGEGSSISSPNEFHHPIKSRHLILRQDRDLANAKA